MAWRLAPPSGWGGLGDRSWLDLARLELRDLLQKRRCLDPHLVRLIAERCGVGLQHDPRGVLDLTIQRFSVKMQDRHGHL